MSFIFGVNGWIWIYPSSTDVTVSGSTTSAGEFTKIEQPTLRIPPEIRQRMARVRNCILLLATYGIEVYPNSVMKAYNLSTEINVAPADLLVPEVAAVIADSVRSYLSKLSF